MRYYRRKRRFIVLNLKPLSLPPRAAVEMIATISRLPQMRGSASEISPPYPTRPPINSETAGYETYSGNLKPPLRNFIRKKNESLLHSTTPTPNTEQDKIDTSTSSRKISGGDTNKIRPILKNNLKSYYALQIKALII